MTKKEAFALLSRYSLRAWVDLFILYDGQQVWRLSVPPLIKPAVVARLSNAGLATMAVRDAKCIVSITPLGRAACDAHRLGHHTRTRAAVARK